MSPSSHGLTKTDMALLPMRMENEYTGIYFEFQESKSSALVYTVLGIPSSAALHFCG